MINTVWNRGIGPSCFDAKLGGAKYPERRPSDG